MLKEVKGIRFRGNFRKEGTLHHRLEWGALKEGTLRAVAKRTMGSCSWARAPLPF